MTRHELDLLTADGDALAKHDRFYQRQRPRRGAVPFSRQRRTPQVSLGIHARGAKRSTFRSLGLGKLRSAPALSAGDNVVLATCTT